MRCHAAARTIRARGFARARYAQPDRGPADHPHRPENPARGRDNDYANSAQRGFGVILDVGGFAKGLQANATAGYHFNRNLFLGAGVGLRVRMDTRKPTSLWTSLYGDVSASYMHFGLKFGWAF